MGSRLSTFLAFKMNKVFIFVLIAFAALASAQNPPVGHRAQPQCKVDKQAYVSLAQAYERILRGQYTTKVYEECAEGDGINCVIEIGVTATECWFEVGLVVGIIDCIVSVIGAGSDCYPCICWVIESLYGEVPFC